eukprot:5747925-Alexandrium_andersonii.AAC.1
MVEVVGPSTVQRNGYKLLTRTLHGCVPRGDPVELAKQHHEVRKCLQHTEYLEHGCELPSEVHAVSG